MNVILINGHGGIIDGVYQTAGKRSPIWPDGRQLFEGDFNRIVVSSLVRSCKFLGMDCIDLVPELEDISLDERVRRANEVYLKRPDSIVIEIHANAGGGTGLEVFTTIGRTKSDPLAEIMIDSMERTLRPFRLRADGSDGDRDKERNFYVIRKVYCPAFLIECAFMDTYEPDCRMMLEAPEQFATAILNGIINLQKKLK